MHWFILSVFFSSLLLFGQAMAQIPSDCTVPLVIEDQYELDVHYLTVQRLLETNAADLDSILVPQVHTDSIVEGLAAIFNISLSERDSVFNRYCIHDHRAMNQVNRSLIVVIDPLAPWTLSWQNLITLTGNPAVDDILQESGFHPVNFYPSLNYVTLNTELNVNPYAVQNALLAISGVEDAFLNSIIGDGDRISYSVAGGVQHYGFTLACGDCPAGCTSFRTWNFQVFDDCSVSYVGAIGSSECLESPGWYCIPTGIEEADSNTEISLSPNPASHLVHLHLSDLNLSLVRLSVTDILGRTMANLELGTPALSGAARPEPVEWEGRDLELNVSTYPNGIYFITLSDRNGFRHTGRLVVQH